MSLTSLSTENTCASWQRESDCEHFLRPVLLPTPNARDVVSPLVIAWITGKFWQNLPRDCWTCLMCQHFAVFVAECLLCCMKMSWSSLLARWMRRIKRPVSSPTSGFAFRTLQGFGNNHSIGITLITNSRTHALLQRTAKQIDKPLFVYRVCHKQVLPGLQGQVRRELDICRGLSFASP